MRATTTLAARGGAAWRFVANCLLIAVALGCQLLTALAPAPEVLLETDFKRMSGRWKSWDAPFTLSRPRVYLALTPDALWGSYRSELMRWPLESVAEVQRDGHTLKLRLAGVSGKTYQFFKLASRREAAEWCERLRALRQPETPGYDGVRAEVGTPAAKLGDPVLDPVILLHSRPSARFQLLGAIEARALRCGRSRAGLVVRGAMIGADAVVNVVEERLAGFRQTTYGASGTALRAVDHDGRVELKSHWFDGQLTGLRLGILVLATLTVIAGLGSVVNDMIRTGTLRWASWPSLVSELWLFGVSVAFTSLRWPQFARATAVSFIALAITGFVSQLGMVAAVAYAASTGNAQAAWILFVFQAVGLALGLAFYSFHFFLGRSTWRVYSEFRDLVTKEVERSARTRWHIGLAALMVSAVFGIWTVGRSLWSAYWITNEAQAILLRPLRRPRLEPPAPPRPVEHQRTALRLAERMAEAQPGRPGPAKRLADARNNLAWHLAVTVPPAQRQPDEAVALAKVAVESFPDEPRYWNTLAAAHRAAGQWDECESALRRSMALSGGGEADWWLTALLERHRGHTDQARQWQQRALDAARRRSRPDSDAEALRREFESAGGPSLTRRDAARIHTGHTPRAGPQRRGPPLAGETATSAGSAP